ncbi:uncharacterized protein [Nicotiana sylvestris]|uniref:uncharacterized protein n=1 Tax=Nicotiana sylvestris TaxID=4096 RepID=UPI00388C7B5C
MPSYELQGQQPQQPRTCYTCGDPRHIARFCPRTSRIYPQQGSRAMVQAPGVPSPARPARGGGRVVSGGGQAARGRGQLVGSHLGDVVQSGRAQPRCYAFPTRPEAKESDAIITDHVYRSCMVIIGGLETRVDLILLDMVDFDVILGMDWLSPYHAILDCHAKTVTLALPGLH